MSRDGNEWLEIDLGELKVLTLVETQGRFGNGQVDLIMVFYVLEIYTVCYYFFHRPTFKCEL